MTGWLPDRESPCISCRVRDCIIGGGETSTADEQGKGFAELLPALFSKLSKEHRNCGTENFSLLILPSLALHPEKQLPSPLNGTRGATGLAGSSFRDHEDRQAVGGRVEMGDDQFLYSDSLHWYMRRIARRSRSKMPF